MLRVSFFLSKRPIAMIEIRKAALGDIPTIMSLLSSARRIMRESGNPNQWKEGYPTEEMIKGDIARGCSYLCFSEEGRAVASFAFIPGPDGTYSHICNGKWVNDDLPYYVLHRIASNGERRGVLHSILEFCSKTAGNIRADTHRDNSIMRHLLEKEGFAYCGIIHISDGSERLAYQRLQFLK